MATTPQIEKLVLLTRAKLQLVESDRDFLQANLRRHYSATGTSCPEIMKQLNKLQNHETNLLGMLVAYNNCLYILAHPTNPLDLWVNDISRCRLRKILKIIGFNFTPLWALEKWGPIN